jgi:glutamate-1-semialdehyde 2,1-aminomutase
LFIESGRECAKNLEELDAMILLHLAAFVGITLLYGLRYILFGQGDGGAASMQGHWLRDYLTRMGPLYVKLGQILATRSDLLSAEIRDQLATLQDDVPPMSEDDLDEVLLAAYEKPPREIFAEFSRLPIASASIAQVHKARLKTGQQVAVKIVKKGVAAKLQENVRIIHLLLQIAHSLFQHIRHLNLPTRFDEITSLLLIQTDMIAEGHHQAVIYESFENHPYVRIPQLYPDFCTKNILVMDFVEGIHVTDMAQVNIPASQMAQRFQDTIYTMLYHHGFCHADPHPGNVFFTAVGEIIFVDFGLVAILNEDEKWELSSYFYACLRQEWEIAVRRFTDCFVIDRGNIEAHLEEYTSAMTAVLKHHYDERKTKWSTYAFFRDFGQVLQQYGAQYTTSFAKIELIFLSCEGVASQIDPNINIWANARRFNDRFSPYMSDAVKATFDQHFGEMIPLSMALEQRAEKSLIAPTHLDRYFVPSAYPLFITKAQGCHIFDVDGLAYIDLSCGYGPHILGYAHPAITDALADCLKTGWVNALGNLPEVELAELLVDAFPGAERAIFSNSGTEAVMQAIRICRAYRQRDAVAKFEGHYHGSSDIGMVSSYFRSRGPVEAPLPIHGSPGCHTDSVNDTFVLQYGHPNAFDQLRQVADQIACVLCEPMPTAVGDYDLQFLQALRTVCTECDIPLVFDEVVSGFRVTYGGVQVLTGIEPDLTCLGKIIGGGLPCGAVVGREKLITYAKTTADPFTDFESRVFVGGTMSGNSLSCAAGVGVLRYLQSHPEIYQQLDAHTEWLSTKLRSFASKHGLPFQLKAKHSIFGMTFSFKPPKYNREKIGGNYKANLALAYYMRKFGVYMPELHTIMLSAAHTSADLEVVVGAFEHS